MASEIEKIGEWKDSKWFNTTCDCGPGHHMQIWIDKEFNDIELHFESKVGYWEKLSIAMIGRNSNIGKSVCGSFQRNDFAVLLICFFLVTLNTKKAFCLEVMLM